MFVQPEYARSVQGSELLRFLDSGETLEDGASAKILLDPEQLVVLGHPIGPGRGAGLDLAAVQRDGKVGDGDIFRGTERVWQNSVTAGYRGDSVRVGLNGKTFDVRVPKDPGAPPSEDKKDEKQAKKSAEEQEKASKKAAKKAARAEEESAEEDADEASEG